MNEKQKELVEQNHKLIYAFLRSNQLEESEYYDLAAIGLCKAAMNYDEEKAKFATFAYACMRWEIYNEVKKKIAKGRIPQSEIYYYQEAISSDEEKLTFEDMLASSDNVENTAMCSFDVKRLLDKLTKKEQEVLKMIVSGYIQQDIAKKCNCSQAHISRIKNKIEKKFMQAGYAY